MSDPTDENDGTLNPYAPPVAADTRWQPTPPASPTGLPSVFGFLSIALGSGYLALCLKPAFTLTLTALSRSLPADLPTDEAARESIRAGVAALRLIDLGSGLGCGLISALSLALIFIAIGQIRHRRWAGRWSVHWSLAAILVWGALLGLHLLVLRPAQETLLAQIEAALPSGDERAVAIGQFKRALDISPNLTVLVAYIIHPLLLLVAFTRDSIRGAMNT